MKIKLSVQLASYQITLQNKTLHIWLGENYHSFDFCYYIARKATTRNLNFPKLKMFRLIILLATISLIEGQRFVSGPCPSIPSMTTFDKARVWNYFCFFFAFTLTKKIIITNSFFFIIDSFWVIGLKLKRHHQFLILWCVVYVLIT